MDRKRLYPILLVIFTNILGAGMILPILPLYAVGRFGATFFQAALLASAYFGAQFFAAPWLGRLSDQHGRRPILIISQIGTVISFLLFVFAGNIGGALEGAGLVLPVSGGLFMMFVARLLDGATGGNITTARAYISDISDQESRTRALGLLSAAFGLGFIFGPAIGGFLSLFSNVAPFIGATVITTGTLLLTTFTLEESLPPEKRHRPEHARVSMPLNLVFANRGLTLILIIGFINTLAFSAIPATMSLYSDQILFPELTDTKLVARNVGIMLTFLGISLVITQAILLPRMLKRFGDRTLVTIGALAFFVSFAGITLIPSAVYATVFLMLFAFARGASDPPLQSLVTRYGTHQNQGRLLGLYQSALSMGLIFGPIWAGFVFQNIAPAAVFRVGAAIVIFSILASMLLHAQPVEVTLESS